MTKNVVTLTSNDTLYRAADIMVRKKFGAIPVVDSRKKLVGIITQSDVLKVVVKRTGKQSNKGA